MRCNECAAHPLKFKKQLLTSDNLSWVYCFFRQFALALSGTSFTKMKEDVCASRLKSLTVSPRTVSHAANVQFALALETIHGGIFNDTVSAWSGETEDKVAAWQNTSMTPNFKAILVRIGGEPTKPP
jgi:hypothetical protein